LIPYAQPIASIANVAINAAGSAAMRMAAAKPRAIIRVMANVTAGERYRNPVSDAILLDVLADDDKFFRTLAPLHCHFGAQQWDLNGGRAGFRWNGADLPRAFEWLVCMLTGFSRYHPRLALATAFHDDACNEANAGRVPRVIGDAIFISLLMPIAFNGRELPGIGAARAALLYAGVRAYSAWLFVQREFGRQANVDRDALGVAVVFAGIAAMLSWLSWRLWL